MTPFTTLTSIAVPMLEANIDTDIIIPSREIRAVSKAGLADGLFAGRRYREGRVPDPDFVLNRPAFAGAQILLGGSNFGCGSSREHAVWALAEYGFRCIIAPSFSPIFAGNCVRNGLLAVESEAAASLGPVVTVDLAAQTIVSSGASFRFEIDAEARAMLLGGLDAIDLTLTRADAIAAWQAADCVARPWIYLNPSGSPASGVKP